MSIRKLFALSMVGLMFGIGCFNQSNPVGEDTVIPSIPNIVFNGPISNNIPANLQQFIGLFNGNASIGLNYLNLAIFTSPSVDENSFSWEVTWDQVTANILAEKNSDGSVDWQVTVNGSDNNVTYTNWVALKGVAELDGNTGVWSIYSENSTTKSAEFTWVVDGNNNKNGTLELFATNQIYELLNNSDKSGSLVLKENNVKVYEAQWNTDGTGTWTSWDAQGNQTDTGNWN